MGKFNIYMEKVTVENLWYKAIIRQMKWKFLDSSDQFEIKNSVIFLSVVFQ